VPFEITRYLLTLLKTVLYETHCVW